MGLICMLVLVKECFTHFCFLRGEDPTKTFLLFSELWLNDWRFGILFLSEAEVWKQWALIGTRGCFQASDQGLSSARLYSDCVASNLSAKTDGSRDFWLKMGNLPHCCWQMSPQNGNVQVSHEGNKLSMLSVSQFQSCPPCLHTLQSYIWSSPALISQRRHL